MASWEPSVRDKGQIQEALKMMGRIRNTVKSTELEKTEVKEWVVLGWHGWSLWWVCVCVHMCVCAIDTMRGDPRQIAKFY